MEKRAKNVETAIDLALAELGVTRDRVNVEVIEEGSKGFFGLGAKEAVVKVTLKKAAKPEVKDEPAKKAAVKKDVKKAPKKEIKKETGEKAKAAVKEEASESALEPKVRAKREAKILTEEEAASAIATAKEFLDSIFEAMSLEVKVSVSVQDGDTLLAHLDGENIGIVIGKRGDTLDALQYLTSLVVNKKSDGYIKVTLDTENYREKRMEALLALAQRLAAKVSRTGRKFTLEPMNPYERRIIHATLQNNEAVTTYSIGQEPYRKVVIAPKNAKPRKSRNNKNAHGDQKKPYNKKPVQPKAEDNLEASEVKAEKKGSYTTTYKADFKPQQHKAQYASYEEYLEAQKNK